MTLIELAVAFALNHPAITSVIIGPRTQEHLEAYLKAATVELTDDVLDRIDEIVDPGRTSSSATPAPTHRLAAAGRSCGPRGPCLARSHRDH